jgi:hypothetical protein
LTSVTGMESMMQLSLLFWRIKRCRYNLPPSNGL